MEWIQIPVPALVDERTFDLAQERLQETRRAHSVYVPPEQGELVKQAHGAWLAFQEAGAQIAAGNRERLLLEMQRDKDRVKTQRAKARGRLGRD